MQIDIGFGDIIHKGPDNSDYPTMLDHPAPVLLGYSRESTVSEKFEAMVKLGDLNSRMKDFYDIRLLSRQFEFEGVNLAEAIRLTFERRGTEIPYNPDAFNEDFAAAKQIQWTAFRKRIQLETVPESFQKIVSDVRGFLEPIITALNQGDSQPLN